MRRLFISVVFVFLFSVIYSQSINCYTIVAGKKATGTGYVMVAHNEDDYGDLIVNMYKVPAQKHSETEYYKLVTGEKIPQAKQTSGYIWFETTKENFGDFFVNDYGVAVCSNACPSKETEAQGILTYDFRKIIIERAKTARQAVKIAGKMIETYGYASSGRTYCFADKNEAWLLAVVKGKIWVARRIPDDQVAIVPNYYTIDTVNLSDTNNYLGAKNLIEYAIKKGWYNPDNSKPFSFREAYGKTLSLYAFWNIPRHWVGYNILTGKAHNIYDKIPFSFKPKQKINLQILSQVLTNHYENTDFQTDSTLFKNPHKNIVSRVCNYGTKFSVIVEFNSDPQKNIIWFAPFNPCINPYIPVVYNIEKFPPQFHKYDYRTTLKHHFEDSPNTFEENPNHAYSLFHAYNESVNRQYWQKQKEIAKNKLFFEKKFRKIRKSFSGEQSYDFLEEYYNFCKSKGKK